MCQSLTPASSVRASSGRPLLRRRRDDRADRHRFRGPSDNAAEVDAPADIDEDTEPGKSSIESGELRDARPRNKLLEQENEVLHRPRGS